jgi:inhibitor of the pro-sigma K processing machinery
MNGFPEWNIIAAVVFGVVVLYIMWRLFYRPLRLVFTVLLHLLLGGALLYLYNLVGTHWGLTIGLNVISALIVGIMGLPGLAMLIGLQYIFS